LFGREPVATGAGNTSVFHVNHLLFVVLRDLSVGLRRLTVAAYTDSGKKRNFLLNHTC
jgi:hypothetical protein